MSFILAVAVSATLSAKLPLVVRTYDSAGVSDAVLAHAEDRARMTLAAAGINPIWRPCHATGCIARPKPHEIEIRFVRSTPASDPGSLGFAAVDVAMRAGTLATIYVDRVTALASQSNVDRDELLGYAVAHEIGHLLLGTTEHAAYGLMRATWRADELRRALPLDWIFSGAEGAEMRRRLSARVAEQPVEESIVVQAHLFARLDDPTTVYKRARRLEPGTRVTVTIKDAAPMPRYFVLVDSVQLVVLNLSADGLPKRQLLNMAIDNPAWMAATYRTIYKDGNVRVGPDGVFVKDRKVCDLAEVVERIPREKVVSLDR
jgi:hypothetical protein